MDEKITKIENLTKEIENEKNFDKSLAKFKEAAELIKQALADGKKEKGKVLEIMRELDEIVERELKED